MFNVEHFKFTDKNINDRLIKRTYKNRFYNKSNFLLYFQILNSNLLNNDSDLIDQNNGEYFLLNSSFIPNYIFDDHSRCLIIADLEKYIIKTNDFNRFSLNRNKISKCDFVDIYYDKLTEKFINEEIIDRTITIGTFENLLSNSLYQKNVLEFILYFIRSKYTTNTIKNNIKHYFSFNELLDKTNDYNNILIEWSKYIRLYLMNL